MATLHAAQLAFDQVLDRVQAGITRAQRLDRPVLVSSTARIDATEPIDLFVAAHTLGEQAFFWNDTAQQFAMLGVGVARAIEHDGPERFSQTAAAWRAVLDQAVIERDGEQGGPTLVGGFAFDPLRPSTATWHGFAEAALVLPRLHWMIKGDAATLTWNLVVAPDAAPHALADSVLRLYHAVTALPARPGPQPGSPLLVSDALPALSWQAIVRDAVSAIRCGAFDKVVLARAVRVIAEHAFDLGRALAYLRTTYPSAYVFAVTRSDRCFLGATPERLVGVRNGFVRATGLAGTTRRGATEAEDARLGAELLASAKERHEHAVVVDMLRAALRCVCDDVTVPEPPHLLKLNNVQHLYTPVTGRLRADHSVLDLLARLHPTPAVGGLPRETALEYIRAHERLDRGWYAGPVGWIDAQGTGEFAVALRSGLVQDRQATLFAGCGIVADSDPQREYAETVLKLKPMLNALQAEG